MEDAVERHTSGMARKIVEAQGVVVGMFTSVSAAIVGLVDKVAMQDQSFRLLGLRYLMTADSARKMDLITKSLNANLGEIYWDKELHQRAILLSEDIDRMTAALGPNFEKNMVGIRNFRMEFDRIKLGVKFLGMGFVSSLFEKLFPNGNALEKLDKWVTNFQQNLPGLADKLANYAVPVLKTTWRILGDIVEVGKEGGVMFTNLIGLLSGDDSIEGTTFSFEKMAGAIQHVANWLERFLGSVANAEKLLAHFASALSLMFAGRWGDAGKEFSAGMKSLTGGSGAILGIAAGGTVGAAGIGTAATALLLPEIGPLAVPAGAAIGALAGPAIGGLLGYGAGKVFGESPSKAEPSQDHVQTLVEATHGKIAETAARDRVGLITAIQQAADKYGVPRSLALAVAEQESGIRQNRKSGAGAIGVMQLMPGTAKDLGVDPNDALQNIEGGVRYLAMLLKHYQGDAVKALDAYNFGLGHIDRGDALPKETQNYAPSVLRLQQQFDQVPSAEGGMQVPGGIQSILGILHPKEWVLPAWISEGLGKLIGSGGLYANHQQMPDVQPNISHQVIQQGDIHVGGITVTQPGASLGEIRREVIDAIREAQQHQVFNDLAQLQPVY